MHSVETPSFCERNPISLFILDWTKVQSGDGIRNSIIFALDVHDFGAILLKYSSPLKDAM
jgi:hypothetical protein